MTELRLNQILIPASIITLCLFVCFLVLLCLEVQVIRQQSAFRFSGTLCYLLKEYFLRTRASGLAELKVIDTGSTKSLCTHLKVYEGPLLYLLFLEVNLFSYGYNIK